MTRLACGCGEKKRDQTNHPASPAMSTANASAIRIDLTRGGALDCKGTRSEGSLVAVSGHVECVDWSARPSPMAIGGTNGGVSAAESTSGAMNRYPFPVIV